MSKGRVVVAAPSWKMAEAWCRANDVPPHGRSTYVVTQSRAGRGFLLHPPDRLVFVGDVPTEVRVALRLAVDPRDPVEPEVFA